MDRGGGVWENILDRDPDLQVKFGVYQKIADNKEPKTIEKEKIIAEKLNGRFAMMGFIALIGAYLTTGQIIPGFI